MDISLHLSLSLSSNLPSLFLLRLSRAEPGLVDVHEKNSKMKICPDYENMEPLTYMKLFIDSKETSNSCLLFAKGIAK